MVILGISIHADGLNEIRGSFVLFERIISLALSYHAFVDERIVFHIRFYCITK